MKLDVIHTENGYKPAEAYYQSNFFFQAVDGIRDGHVTGVQTCALPIYDGPVLLPVLCLIEKIGTDPNCHSSAQIVVWRTKAAMSPRSSESQHTSSATSRARTATRERVVSGIVSAS